MALDFVVTFSSGFYPPHLPSKKKSGTNEIWT